ncbi:DMT family transporter [Pseudomonas sp. NCCP-436]|uniref:EamA family transporter n=1 Tax=Pseudomonas sp. NCCP-436 TaxID=2842481 RepID=UPI001C8178ED|nr:DMT family transporter [Pseudomonas sp. NCCP-436]GIZ11283.1 membrane protein [Pseudomonas sp. NCCP-436]
MHRPSPFPRHLAVLTLAMVAWLFAGNHVAARIAFDHNTGLLLAMLCRAGVTLVALAALVLCRREPLKLGRSTWNWQILLGLLITIQSFCIYSAVARIPVALALLVVNLSPMLLALLSWALGGPAPTRQAIGIMGMILFGLVLVLDIPTRLTAGISADSQWLTGILFGLTAATAFSVALWITEHRLSKIAGSVRSMLTLLVVFTSSALLGVSDLLPGSLALPTSESGWIALLFLVLLYGVAFSTLFICMPRLDIARNSPVMNMEPVAGMVLGWLILDQVLGSLQVIGGLIVVSGVALLAYRR